MTYCDDCGYYETNDRVTYIEHLDRHVCEDCLDHYYYCDDCNKYYYAEDVRYIDNLDVHICNNCIDDYRQCDACGDYQRISDMYERDGEYYCEDCYKEEDEDVSEDM